MRHNNIESIQALTHDQQPSMEATSMADANNNNSHGHATAYSPLAADAAGTLASEIRKDEKYSLRQRQSRRTTLDSRTTNRTSAAVAAATAATASSATSAASTGTATTKEKPPPKEKPKPKAAPLSKYRRKTANARERSRMREINSAFENLRRAVPLAVAGTSGTSSPVSSPQQCSSSGGASSSEKLTKITTLRMAMKYIRILSDMLSSERAPNGGYDNNNDLDMINHNEIEREVMQKGLLLRDGLQQGYGSPDLSPVRPLQYDPASGGSSSSSSSTTTSGHSTAASGNNSRKRSASKKSASGGSKAKKSAPASSTRTSSRKLPSRGSSQAVKQAPSLTSGVSPTPSLIIPDPTIDPGPGLDTGPLSMDVDLGSVLESDNDSLILSERCLSPGVTAGLKGAHGFPGCSNQHTSDSTVVPNDNLEFGLFLESDADSLQLSEPCLSPLSHLDALNPFNELLHTGFNEQTALELYL